MDRCTRVADVSRVRRRFSPGAEATSPLEGRRLLSAATVTTLPQRDEANFLDDAGDVVGVLNPPTNTASSVFSAFFLPRGGMTVPIGLLPGDEANDVVAVNPSGLVAGISLSAPSIFLVPHGFLYSKKAGLAPIPTLPGFAGSYPTALSDGGLVVGYDLKLPPPISKLSTFHWATPGFVYGKRLGLVGLGSLPGFPTLAPTAVNDAAGLVVGAASPPPDPTATNTPATHAFAFSLATRKAVDLGTLPGFDTSAAEFINAKGMIAGELTNSANLGVTDVFSYTRSTGMRDIGHLPGFDQIRPVSLLDDGRLILQVTNSKTGASAAAEYTIRGGLMDLGALPTVADIGPVSPYLEPANAHGLALVVVSNDLSGASSVYLDDLTTGRLIDLGGVLGPGRAYDLGSGLGSAPVQINDAGEFLAPVYFASNLTIPNQTDLITLNPKGFPPARSDLSVAVTGLPKTAHPGAVVTATVTVTNAGPDRATGSTLTVGLGPGWTLASATGPGWSGRSGLGYADHLGPLVNGGSVHVTLRLRAKAAAAATVTAAVANRTDPKPSNNKATAATTIA